MQNINCYTYYQSPIGMIRIGGNRDYIFEAIFCDKKEPVPVGGKFELNNLLQNCVEQFIEYFQGERKKFEIPVYQKGTSFQQKVWNELLEIPYGKTISYLELAKKIGDQKATRAVAQANRANQIMILIPCHRVIGTDRNLTGYAGGLPRKKWLLKHEFQITNGIQILF